MTMRASAIWTIGLLTSASALAQESGLGCVKDTDCKGDRICIAGACQEPAGRGASPNYPPPPPPNNPPPPPEYGPPPPPPRHYRYPPPPPPRPVNYYYSPIIFDVS